MVEDWSRIRQPIRCQIDSNLILSARVITDNSPVRIFFRHVTFTDVYTCMHLDLFLEVLNFPRHLDTDIKINRTFTGHFRTLIQ